MALTDDDEWAPTSTRMRPDVGALLVEDSAREFDLDEQTKFFEQLAEDYGPMEIGLAMGWSPAMVDRFTSDPDRLALIEMIQEAQNESVERGILRAARAGNSTAMKLWAFNRMQHRGWADRSKLEITGRSQHELVLSVREALDAQLTEAVNARGLDAIAELQAGFLTPDVPVHDADIVDAEVVDDPDVHA